MATSHSNTSQGDTTDVFGYTVDGSGVFSHRLDYRGRNRASNTPPGTVALGSGVGGGSPTISLVAGSTDDIGTINLHLGTGSPQGQLCIITFHDPYPVAPFVQLQARDAAGAGGIYFATTSTTQLIISCVNVILAGSIVLVDYDCTGGG